MAWHGIARQSVEAGANTTTVWHQSTTEPTGKSTTGKLIVTSEGTFADVRQSLAEFRRLGPSFAELPDFPTLSYSFRYVSLIFVNVR